MELKRLKCDVVYRGRIFDLIVDEVEYPSGNKSVREIAHHPGGAVTVPLLPYGRVIFVTQLRYPLGTHLVELPAGKLQPGEEPAVAALRELEEETGWSARSLEPLASLYTTPGFCDEVLHIYLATELVPSPHGPRREEGELSMTLRMIPLPDAMAMAERGELQDAKTVAGLMLAEKRLERKKHTPGA